MQLRVVHPFVLQWQAGDADRFDGSQGSARPTGTHAVPLGGRLDPIDPFVDDVDLPIVQLVAITEATTTIYADNDHYCGDDVGQKSPHFSPTLYYVLRIDIAL